MIYPIKKLKEEEGKLKIDYDRIASTEMHLGFSKENKPAIKEINDRLEQIEVAIKLLERNI